MLGKANEDGHFALRVEYDLEGERRQDMMKDVSLYTICNYTVQSVANNFACNHVPI